MVFNSEYVIIHENLKFCINFKALCCKSSRRVQVTFLTACWSHFAKWLLYKLYQHVPLLLSRLNTSFVDFQIYAKLRSIKYGGLRLVRLRTPVQTTSALSLHNHVQIIQVSLSDWNLQVSPTNPYTVIKHLSLILRSSSASLRSLPVEFQSS